MRSDMEMLGWMVLDARYNHIDDKDVMEPTLQKEKKDEIPSINPDLTKAIDTAEPIVIADKSMEISTLQADIKTLTKELLDTRCDMLETMQLLLKFKIEEADGFHYDGSTGERNSFEVILVTFLDSVLSPTV